jgi:hypothetical protein
VDEVDEVELGEAVLLGLLDIVLNMGEGVVVEPRAHQEELFTEGMAAVPYSVLVVVVLVEWEAVLEEAGEYGGLGRMLLHSPVV